MTATNVQYNFADYQYEGSGMEQGFDSGHLFGGSWTEQKLEILSDYLSAYTTALSRQRFRKLYIDAFAGTGYRTLSDAGRSSAEALQFPELAAEQPQALLEGSAVRALRTTPPFDEYLFMERSPQRFDALNELRKEFPTRHITLLRGDANEQIRALCQQDWRSRRAVLFLDPYGMQVEWVTIEAIARTQAIDLWILFPLGMGVNRLLTKSGNIPDAWRARLDVLFGGADWYDAFYRAEGQPRMFDDGEERLVKAKVETIGEYFVERLRSVFAGVASNPVILRNSTNSPLYLLCFAVGSKAGAPIALRIAEHVLRPLR